MRIELRVKRRSISFAPLKSRFTPLEPCVAPLRTCNSPLERYDAT
jgi:hypothetical protein